MLSDHRQGDKRARSLFTLSAALLLTAAAPMGARAIGEATLFDVRQLEYGDAGSTAGRPRESATRRLAWEVRKRTSIETRLRPSTTRLTDPSLFETPFLYWAGEREFSPLSNAEITGLRRFVEFGGFVLIDDASPDGSGFDTSVRRALSRAFPDSPATPIAAAHTLYRSFYLLSRPVGRVRGPEHLRGVTHGGRLGVVYSRHDLGGAWARDNLGTWEHSVTPGGERQRENAIRLGVNVVMYALCLDYKDDQVHAPFIMRRRGPVP